MYGLYLISSLLYYYMLFIDPSFVSLCRLQAQESMLNQSQTCVQQLTTELRNRCLELRDLNQRVQEDDKLIQVSLST